GSNTAGYPSTDTGTKQINGAADKTDGAIAGDTPDLSERDQIDLLAAGIKLPMIQVAATDLRIEKLSDFLEHMRRVTEAAVTPFNGHKHQGPKPSANSAAKTAKDIVCRNCQRKGHAAKDCRSQVICYNCQQPGHTKPQCPSKSGE
ncbi:gag, partial [Lasius niger]